MKLAKIILLSMLVSACQGTEEDSQEYVQIDGALQEYVDMYVEYGAQYGVNIEIKSLIVEITEEDLGTRVAQCTIKHGKPNVIQFSKKHYDAYMAIANESIRTAKIAMTMFHELGHCERFRGHLHDHDNGHAESLMYPVALSSYHWTNEELRDEMLREFFAPEAYNDLGLKI